MAIFFVCPCGQDLRADEKQAGGQVPCVACGCLVSVPSLQAANRSVGITAVPALELPAQDTPAPTVPRADEEDTPYRLAPPPADAAFDAVGEEVKRRQIQRWLKQAREDIAARRQVGGSWRRETYWFQSLLYPLLASPLVFGLALGWLILTLAFLSFLPGAPDLRSVLPALPLLALPFLLFAYTVAFFRCVLLSASRGEAGFVAWPGAGFVQIGWSALVALLGFLAGPVVPAALAFLFWLNSGDLQLTDWLIVWELATLAVAGWILGLVAGVDSNRLGPVFGGAVGVVWRRGWGILAIALLGAAVAAGLGVLALAGMDNLQGESSGFLILVYFWAGELFWMVFLLRWLGLACFRMRKQGRKYYLAPALPEHTSLA